MKINNMLKQIFYFYYDGFRKMTVGKKLWIIILLKLFIMFAILKIFFFKDFLKTKFETDQQRSEYVIDRLTH
jgi:hypothetical protein